MLPSYKPYTSQLLEAAASVGIWGDGVVGYLLSLCIKKEYPNLRVTVFGKHEEKLLLFSHADSVEILREDYSSIPDIVLLLKPSEAQRPVKQ